MKLPPDLARYYQLADVFVFPSKTDTFGLVLLESITCGMPGTAFSGQRARGIGLA